MELILPPCTLRHHPAIVAGAALLKSEATMAKKALTEVDSTTGAHVAQVDYSHVVDIIHTLSPEELAGLPALVPDGLTVVPKGWLLGVPFTVTAVTFWTPPADKSSPSGYRTGYVSCETTIGSVDELQRAIDRGRVLERTGDNIRVIEHIEQLGFYPGERVLFNDESTGVRRQIVDWLIKVGLITLPTNTDKHHGNPLDMPWPLWESFAEHTMQGEVAVPRFTRLPNGQPFLIRATRGLRVSEYTNDYGPGETYYFG